MWIKIYRVSLYFRGEGKNRKFGYQLPTVLVWSTENEGLDLSLGQLRTPSVKSFRAYGCASHRFFLLTPTSVVLLFSS